MDGKVRQDAEMIAEAHVEWFLEILGPLLKTQMEHGFKHGVEYQQQLEKGEDQ